MAQLNDLLVMGQSTLLGPVNINDKLQLTKLYAPIENGSSSFGPGQGATAEKPAQVLRSNGTTIYWGDDPHYADYVTGEYNSTTKVLTLRVPSKG